MSSMLRIHSLDLLGGHPVLDFVNTLDWRARATSAGGPVECLVSYEALLVWGERAGLLTAAERSQLETFGRAQPGRAAVALSDALVLREAIYRLLITASAGRPARPEDLQMVNRWLPSGRLILAMSGEHYVWAKPDAPAEPGMLLARLAQAAGELLVSGGVQRVGCCAGPGCGWLYLDTSPNRQRRWCSMQGCGNRAKAQRHYKRSRQRV